MMLSAAARPARRAGFTLVELMIAIMLVAILATFVLTALAGVTETAREDRTKAQIAKINELILDKWESYLYRKMPPASPIELQMQRGARTPFRPSQLSRFHLAAVREMMRMELPDHQDDVLKPAKYLMDANTGQKYQPALWRAYQRRVTKSWTPQHEGAECLYLILSQMREADSTALEHFAENEIGDVDGDGMPEILDAWGTPIEWLRWAPGFLSPLQRSVLEEPEQEDMFDPSHVGSAYDSNRNVNLPRALYPLIYSAGPDRAYGLVSGAVDDSSGSLHSWYDADNDPYDSDDTRRMFRIGAFKDDNPELAADNITNHLLTTR